MRKLPFVEVGWSGSFNDVGALSSEAAAASSTFYDITAAISTHNHDVADRR
jgi:hypothetical protein